MCTVLERQNPCGSERDKGWATSKALVRLVIRSGFAPVVHSVTPESDSIPVLHFHTAAATASSNDIRMDIRSPKLRGSARLFLPTLRAPAVAGMAGDLSERPTSRNADSRQARQQLHLLLPGLERPNMWRSKGLAGFHPVLLSYLTFSYIR